MGRVVQGGVLLFALFCNEQEIKTAVLSMQRTLSKREWHAHEHGQIWLLRNARGTEITSIKGYVNSSTAVMGKGV